MKAKCKQLPQLSWFPSIKAYDGCSQAWDVFITICRPSHVLSLQPFSDLSIRAMVVSDWPAWASDSCKILSGFSYLWTQWRVRWWFWEVSSTVMVLPEHVCVVTLQTPAPERGMCLCLYMRNLLHKTRTLQKLWIFLFSKCLKLL